MASRAGISPRSSFPTISSRRLLISLCSWLSPSFASISSSRDLAVGYDMPRQRSTSLMLPLADKKTFRKRSSLSFRHASSGISKPPYTDVLHSSQHSSVTIILPLHAGHLLGIFILSTFLLIFLIFESIYKYYT